MIYGKIAVTQQLIIKMSYQESVGLSIEACFRRQEHFQNILQTQQCLSF